MAGKKNALGKGLANLFSEEAIEEEKEVVVKEVIVKEPSDTMLKITEVEPNRNQPRKNFDEDLLQELADSIKQYGIIQPLIVQKRDDYYEIIAGERRWRAAKIAGLKEVPVIIKDYTDREIVEIALIENIQRADLNPIEEAQAYQRLIKEYNLKQDEVAEKVSKSRATITNSMRLLKLDDRVKQMLIDEMITSGHARALLGIEDKELQYTIAMRVFDEKMSVRDIEKIIKDMSKPTSEKKTEIDEAVILAYKNLEDKIKNIIGSKVVIKNKDNNKGKIEIDYYSQEELERIVDMIAKIR
ncbi:MAG: ParB/RepB/Spo0J family partition protein [Lachnospiraceae bacterium]|uniref:ParB/RepB/Spo0J family partition protein n=1 Tax=Falcatimonas sp. MSJ-15 TaxID=2841515 RepID=UPI001C104136|nr:ParB/RepB/Spo0J family partition protein [Falcatimonas sp. MSJ-15]MBQ5735032.1 ParB/RepB/Spo0J family partition protein [Lachnospiraceae bacterium]MBU5470878.1 ParB/RepB/Spo0J family partition protein [Falcatimonas sp. MSJ-15]MEE0959688.1 ParB/RepB/Spo0J family partition protein [Lachnospiraceae bacterium]